MEKIILSKSSSLHHTTIHSKDNQYLGWRIQWWLACLAVLIIPVNTFFFALNESPFQYTMSNIGNYFGWELRMDFIWWGVITGVCILYYLDYLFRITDFQNIPARRWLYLSIFFLILTVLTPSIKDLYPISTQFHLIFTVLFAASLLISIILFIKFMGDANPEIADRSKKWLIGILGGTLITFILFGLTGVFELCFMTSFSAFLISLGIWLRRDGNIGLSFIPYI